MSGHLGPAADAKTDSFLTIAPASAGSYTQKLPGLRTKYVEGILTLARIHGWRFTLKFMSKFGAIVLISSIGFVVPAPAFGNTSIPNPGTGPSSTSQTSVSPECVAQITALYEAGKIPAIETSDCTATVKTQTSAAMVPDEEVVINSIGGMSAADQADINASLNAGTIRSRNWTQTTYGSNYSQAHGGLYFYDGSRAWSQTTYRNRKGSHQCYTNYVVLAGITSDYCDDSWNGVTLTEGHRFTISFAYKGSPVSYGRKMFADFSRSGGASYRY